MMLKSLVGTVNESGLSAEVLQDLKRLSDLETQVTMLKQSIQTQLDGYAETLSVAHRHQVVNHRNEYEGEYVDNIYVIESISVRPGDAYRRPRFSVSVRRQNAPNLGNSFEPSELYCWPPPK